MARSDGYLMMKAAIAMAVAILALVGITPTGIDVSEFMRPPSHEGIGTPSLIITKEDRHTVLVDGTTEARLMTSADDGGVIQQALSIAGPGDVVLVRSGDYRITEPLIVGDGARLVGEGNMTRLVGPANPCIEIVDRTDVILKGISILCDGGIEILGKSLGSEGIRVEDVIATTGPLAPGAFVIYTYGATISEVSFINCTAMSCGGSGFFNDAVPDRGLLRDVSYYWCKSIDSGRTDRFNNWVVGFDLSENVAIDGMRLVGCEARGNWESGFHFETRPKVKDVVMIDCISEDNGNVKPDPEFGYGFLLNSDTTLIRCAAKDNRNGDFHVPPFEFTITCHDCRSGDRPIYGRLLSPFPR